MNQPQLPAGISLAAVAGTADLAAVAADSVNDAFDRRLFDGCRGLLNLLLADDPAALWNLDRFTALAARCTSVADNPFFRTTFAQQTDLFLFDLVFVFGHLLYVGDHATDFFQLAAAATRAGMKQSGRLTRDHNSQSNGQRQQKLLHDPHPCVH
jgi:hypothetical protein